LSSQLSPLGFQSRVGKQLGSSSSGLRLSSLRSSCPFLGLLFDLLVQLQISSRLNSDSLLILLYDIKLNMLLSLHLGIFEARWRDGVDLLRGLRVLYFLLASPL
jgi:hypothetical protein